MTIIAQAEVEIHNFRGAFQDNAVVLEWETGAEIDLLGFIVSRSNEQFGNYSPLSNQIPHTGDAELGGYYIFTDTSISSETTYWYQLQAVQVGNLVTYSDRVRVVTGQLLAPTSTLVSTPTRTPTATEFSPTSVEAFPTGTSPPTASLLVTRTPTTSAGTALFTPTGTTTPEVTEAISATTTLIPLPEITLIFPTPATNLDISSEGSAKIQGDSSEDQRKDILKGIGRAFFLGFIVLIWLVLGVWIYLASRRVE